MVTVGLMCAPETCPNAYTATSTASPNATEIAMTFADDSGANSSTATTVPAPKKVRMKVPMTSASRAPNRELPYRGTANGVLPVTTARTGPPFSRPPGRVTVDPYGSPTGTAETGEPGA